VGNVVKISLEGLPDQYQPGDWQLNLNGKISDVIRQGEFENWASQNSATYTDLNGNIYTGISLWRLMGWVDDRIPFGPNGFNDAAATAGYKVIVKASDGYAKEFTSQAIGKNDNFIIANTMNGAPLPTDGTKPPYPLRLVGSGATGGSSVGNVVEIQLTDFQTPVEAPKLHIIKYGSDATTVINETYIDYTYMENNLPVIGDGATAYKFEGLTMDSLNLWDPEETYPGGFKVSNVVKGTPVRDLAELVGGMGSGTTITFIASDGFETTLPYSSIYTNPAIQARQGDAFIAWWGDGQYVPQYADGMRLFFTSGADHVYGHWDMHETLPSDYWRYNFQNGIQYPSAAGLSAKYITTIKVYSSPESDWTLELDGRNIGGINYIVAKPFLEEALACQFGSDHKATYTDNKGRVWEGMPLWFFAGFVDDADQHSPNAFNETKALTGYNIVITGMDGYNTTISSKDVIRSSNYLVANSLNGTHIADTDENWPLRFTGANVTGSMTVKGVKSIHLVPADTDNDSILDAEEQGPAGTDPTFDGNSDGTPDSQQGNVASFHTTTNDYITLASLGGMPLADVQAVNNPSPADTPKYLEMPFGFVEFAITDVTPGGAATVQLYLPAGTTVNTYYKWGKTPDNAIPHWYEFLFDGATGAEINENVITLHFVDGSRGDNDITVNGIIIDPSGPGIDMRTPPVANAGADQTAIVKELVKFDGSHSFDPDGMISGYIWNFGDGSTGTGMVSSHKFLTPGIFTVTLTVTDGDGMSASDSAQVTVKSPSEGIQDIIEQIKSFHLKQGVENSLIMKLNTAVKSLQNGNLNPTKNQMNACINEIVAQKGKAITGEQAAILTAEIQKIIQLL
jgi:PKD domain